MTVGQLRDQLKRQARALGKARSFERMNGALDRLLREAMSSYAYPFLRREYNSLREGMIQAWESGRREALTKKARRA